MKNNYFINSCKNISESNYFNWGIIVIIVINALILGLETYSSLSAFRFLFSFINSFALFVFVIEAIIKIVAVYPLVSKYFFNPWDFFDFSIIILSFVPSVGPFVTIFRVARLLRIIRIVRKFNNLEIMIDALFESFKSIGSVFILLLLLLYTYGIMGFNLFGKIDPDRWGTLGSSIITLFTVATLTNWDTRLFSAMGGNPYAWVFFFSFVILAALVVINLFVGVMLYNVTESSKKNSSKGELSFSEKEIIAELKEIKKSINQLENKNKK